MGMSAMFLLVGCLNLGNLQLARLSGPSAGNRRPRSHWGRAGWRILQQLMVEDLLLLVIGGALALVTSPPS